MNQDIRPHLSGLDGHGVGLEAVLQFLYGITFRIYDFNSESPVVIPLDRGNDRDAEIFHILLYGIYFERVGEHNVFVGFVDIRVLGAGSNH